jgi:hypothetical protein
MPPGRALVPRWSTTSRDDAGQQQLHRAFRPVGASADCDWLPRPGLPQGTSRTDAQDLLDSRDRPRSQGRTTGPRRPDHAASPGPAGRPGRRTDPGGHRLAGSGERSARERAAEMNGFRCPTIPRSPPTCGGDGPRRPDGRCSSRAGIRLRGRGRTEGATNAGADLGQTWCRPGRTCCSSRPDRLMIAPHATPRPR